MTDIVSAEKFAKKYLESVLLKDCTHLFYKRCKLDSEAKKSEESTSDLFAFILAALFIGSIAIQVLGLLDSQSKRPLFRSALEPEFKNISGLTPGFNALNLYIGAHASSAHPGISHIRSSLKFIFLQVFDSFKPYFVVSAEKTKESTNYELRKRSIESDLIRSDFCIQSSDEEWMLRRRSLKTIPTSTRDLSNSSTQKT